MRSPTQSTVRPEIACDRASKSNIVIRSIAASAETIGAIEIVFDIKRDRVFQRCEAAVIAGAAQPIDSGLREILIAVADRLGYVDILDVRIRAERGIGRQHKVFEAARFAGADIEQPGNLVLP